MVRRFVDGDTVIDRAVHEHAHNHQHLREAAE
jgi:hypothetical protein